MVGGSKTVVWGDWRAPQERHVRRRLCHCNASRQVASWRYCAPAVPSQNTPSLGRKHHDIYRDLGMFAKCMFYIHAQASQPFELARETSELGHGPRSGAIVVDLERLPRRELYVVLYLLALLIIFACKSSSWLAKYSEGKGMGDLLAEACLARYIQFRGQHPR